jgi:hypothetical protein
MSVFGYIVPLLIPAIVIFCSLITLGILHNGNAGEYIISKKAAMYMPLYAVGGIVLGIGLLQWLYDVNEPKLKAIYLYNLCFIAYVLASYSMYLSTQTVSLSLI